MSEVVPIKALDTQASRNVEKLLRDFGPVLRGALEDPLTIEVLLNPDSRLWQERLGEDIKLIGTIEFSRAEAILGTIASSLNVAVTSDTPILEGELPTDGSRFAGWVPPIVRAPSFAIRKKASSVFTLLQYLEAKVITQRQYDYLCNAIRNRKNILVIGGTGSGKTTLTNALIHQLVLFDPQARLVLIEDTGELQCSAANYVTFRSSGNVSITQLLKTTLRARPDRIIVGEVRGPEALDMIDAWNTGHEGGFGTLHANNPEQGLTRMQSLISRNPFAPRVIEPLIGEAVHVIVHIAKTPVGRRVKGVLEISGYKNGAYITQPIEA